MKWTYSKAGVNRQQRKKAKSHLSMLKETHVFHKGKILYLPFNAVYEIEGKYYVKTADGVGTKVMLAQIADKHDTIGIDAVAMVVNDCVRNGTKPISITNIIDIQRSDEKILKEIAKGLKAGATVAECPIVGGEVADVPELLNVKYHINCDCFGVAERENIINGEVKTGDIIIGLRSSGLHSNGISLARKILFKEWGGKFDTFEKVDGIDEELVYEVLKPTSIYSNEIIDANKKFRIKAAINVTGDAYLKLNNLKKGKIGFHLDSFKPQEIFNAIQEHGSVNSKEMFSTFNMGWGFMAIVDKKNAESVLDFLNKNIESEIIGKVTDSSKIVLEFEKKKIVL